MAENSTTGFWLIYTDIIYILSCQHSPKQQIGLLKGPLVSIQDNSIGTV